MTEETPNTGAPVVTTDPKPTVIAEPQNPGTPAQVGNGLQGKPDPVVKKDEEVKEPEQQIDMTKGGSIAGSGRHGAVLLTIIGVVALILIGYRGKLFLTGSEALPGEDEYKHIDSRCVLRVQTGEKDHDGSAHEGGESLDGQTLSVWLRNFDGWIMDEAAKRPAWLLNEADMKLADFLALKARREKAEKDRAAKLGGTGAAPAPNPEDVARWQQQDDAFTGWLNRKLNSLRLTIGGETFASMTPDFMPKNAVKAPVGAPKDAKGEVLDTWNLVVFRCVKPTTVDESKQWEGLIRSYGLECQAPITLAVPVADDIKDTKQKVVYLPMPTQINKEGQGALQNFAMPLRPRLMQTIALLVMVGSTWLILWVCRNTGVLRVPLPEDRALVPTWKESPWSTSRLVLAWWVAICACCFLFLWALKGQTNVLSKSAAILMGVQGSTLLAAGWAAGVAATRTPKPARATAKEGFWKDIVSEGEDAEISKLQMLVWNGVLGMVFLVQTFQDFQMPDFDATLHTLLGISSGAYVGYKAQQ